MKKNVASQVVGAQLVSKTDGSPVTTGTTTVSVTGDGGTQATGSVGSGAATHEGNGYWTYAPAQAETNYDLAAFTFVNTSAINVTVQIYTSFPQTGDNYPLVDTEVAAIKAKTDQLTFTTANKVDSTIQAAGDLAQAAADKVWSTTTRALTDKAGFSLASGSIVEATFGVGAITATVTDATFDNSIADALLDRTDAIETGLTPRKSLRLNSAVLGGVLSGAATTTATIKGAGVATTRVTATVDADGNRSALTLNL